MSYHRINLDGKSITETRPVAADAAPGTFATINGSGQFAKATAVKGRMYVIGAGESEGLTVADNIPADHSAVGEYVEEGRELAILCAAGTYAKDTPIKVNASGQGAVGVDGTDAIVGFSQDAVVLTAAGLVRVRMRATQKAAA